MSKNSLSRGCATAHNRWRHVALENSGWGEDASFTETGISDDCTKFQLCDLTEFRGL